MLPRLSDVESDSQPDQPTVGGPDPTQPAREAMVRGQIEARGVRDERVLEAMRRVPRHLFIPEADPADAYRDEARATDLGQTISQPYVVARMSELLEVEPRVGGMSVLEIGAGSGYAAAVLSAMGARVVSVERHPELAERARAAVARAGVEGVEVVVGDGTLGWPSDAPYDRIIVTAAAPSLPPELREQLTDPGRIVIPIGTRDTQSMLVFRLEDGRWHEDRDFTCRFVPLVGEAGWEG